MPEHDTPTVSPHRLTRAEQAAEEYESAVLGELGRTGWPAHAAIEPAFLAGVEWMAQWHDNKTCICTNPERARCRVMPAGSCPCRCHREAAAASNGGGG